MALLDLKTDLKSLKYGNDQPGGGSSKQPYIKTSVETGGYTGLRAIDKVVGKITSFDDGLIRGGTIKAGISSLIDTIRVGQFLTDFPKGPLFIAKQVGLQLSNPKLEFKKLPSGPGFLGFLGGLTNAAQDKLGLIPTRIYNLGINTLAQVPVNAFGIHFNRHGLLPVQDESTKYEAVVTANNVGKGDNNRLILLKNKLIKEPNSTSDVANVIDRISKFAKRFGIIKRLPLNLRETSVDDYIGGPGSIYGVGKTTIRRFVNTSNEINKIPIQDSIGGNSINYTYTLGLSDLYFESQPVFVQERIDLVSDSSEGNAEYNNIDVSAPTNIPSQLTQTAVKYNGPISNKATRYNELKAQIDNQNKLQDNSANGSNIGINNFNIHNIGIYTTGSINSNKSYKTTEVGNITYKNSYSGSVTLKFNNWFNASRENRLGSDRQDIINLTPIFDTLSSDQTDSVGNFNINDLVRFRIQAVNTEDPGRGKWMVFRAYITSFSDSTNAEWIGSNYIGRSDKFYVYNGFNRKINMIFKVAALSEKEMKTIYQKLNFLMSNLMPDYGGGIVIRGPLTRMSVGNWIDTQLGIIDSVTYTIPDDSPWEISIDNKEGEPEKLVLPHVVEVSLGFIPIGSETRGNNLIPGKSLTTSHIAQNNTGDITEKNQYIDGTYLLNENNNYISKKQNFNQDGQV